MFRPAPFSIACAALLSLLAPACRRATPPPEAPRDAAFVAAVNRGVAQMGQYDFAGAVTTFSALAAAHPADAGVGVNLALARINRQAESDDAEAERLLATLVSDAAVGTRARYALGLLRLHAGRDAEAAAVLTEVAASVPADPYPAYFAGQALLASAPEQALVWFDKAQALNPRLRSAAYGAFQALQRLGRADQAAPKLAQFQALERDPRAEMAEFKYTRMGPLATAITLDAPPATTPPPVPLVQGTAFTAARALSDPPEAARVADSGAWRHHRRRPRRQWRGRPLPRQRRHRRLAQRRADERRGRRRSSPPTRSRGVRGVRTALWGDIDDDGLLDVALLGNGTTSIWRQSPAGRWRDVTTVMRAPRPTSMPSTAPSSTPTTTATSTCGWSTGAVQTSC